MPRYEMTDDQILADTEKFFLEQAKAYFLELRHAAQNAPKGKVIRNVELLALEKGRELLRQTTEHIVQEQNDLLEKKKNSANVTADANEDTSDTDRITS